MEPKGLLLISSIVLFAGGGTLLAFGYFLGGVIAVALGCATLVLRKP
jgi:hypothetical protein